MFPFVEGLYLKKNKQLVYTSFVLDKSTTRGHLPPRSKSFHSSSLLWTCCGVSNPFSSQASQTKRPSGTKFQECHGSPFAEVTSPDPGRCTSPCPKTESRPCSCGSKSKPLQRSFVLLITPKRRPLSTPNFPKGPLQHSTRDHPILQSSLVTTELLATGRFNAHP